MLQRYNSKINSDSKFEIITDNLYEIDDETKIIIQNLKNSLTESEKLKLSQNIIYKHISGTKIYIEDSQDTREWMIDTFGESLVPLIMYNQYTYIEFCIEENTWCSTPPFQWLYVPNPELVEKEYLLQFKK